MKLTAKLASDIRLLVASKAQLLILPFKFIKLILLLFQFKHSMGFVTFSPFTQGIRSRRIMIRI